MYTTINPKIVVDESLIETIPEVPKPIPNLSELSSREIFHSLWGKAVGTPHYNKKEWSELQARLRF